MLAPMSDWVRKHRIVATRLAVAAALPAFLLSGSAREGTVAGSLLFFLGLVLAGLGMVGRIWCAVYISGLKDKSLVTGGPYSVTRNPLYFSSLLGVVGIGMTTETLLFPAAAALLFALFYPAVIGQEEAKLRHLFGEAFESYCRRTPRFFPDFRKLSEPDRLGVDPVILRGKLHSSLWFLVGIGLIRIVGVLHRAGILPVLWRVY